MQKKWKTGLLLVLCLGILLTGLSGCKTKSAEGQYTFRTYTSALAQNWSPHSWRNSNDRMILGYLTSPFCTPVIKDSVTGEYQWSFEMASSITDVTAANQEDLETYNVHLPDGKSAEEVTEGFVFEIVLNPSAKWEDGTAINADSYVYSMQMLLDADLNNYRANLYRQGACAVAGGSAYSASGAPVYQPMVKPYQSTGDFSYDLEKGIREDKVYINVETTDMTLYPMSLQQFNTTYALGLEDQLQSLANQANAYGYTLLTKDNLQAAKDLVAAIAPLFGLEYSDDLLKEALWVFEDEYEEKADYEETVGCYRVDDYTLRYVTENPVTREEFLSFCTSNWLVHQKTYENSIDRGGTKTGCSYGTNLESTKSYGPYRLEKLSDKQMVLVQNENWYGWEKQADGSLISYTKFLVDGKKVQQYQTTSIVVEAMDGEAANKAFAAGQLTQLGLAAEDVQAYAQDARLLTAQGGAVYSLFFNTDTKALQAMDAAKGNVNSLVLSVPEFRKALSLAIDRQALAAAEGSSTPALGLVNENYYYDVHNDPNSVYRTTAEGMAALCKLYGISYGEGEFYETAGDAYSQITGYDLTRAKELLALACSKLLVSGQYTAGQEVRIRIAWSTGALDTRVQAMVNCLNQFMNAAAEGSGFGTITFEAVGNVQNPYTAVPAGDFAIGYGAWNGGAASVTSIMQLYCDSSTYRLNEAGCWDPANTKLTLQVEGEPVTLTWQEWSRSLEGSGPYAQAANSVKLSILSQLESEFLAQYYRIPLLSEASAVLLSGQASYYTNRYSNVYGFGGLRLMTYHYDDAQWAKQDHSGK